MATNKTDERNQEATIYVGNLDERTTDAILWELFLQCGPVVNVHLPKDRVSQTHQGFGFCEFLTIEDAEYACRIMNQIKLYGKPIRVNKASADKKNTIEIGAELFVGNLDPLVNEKVLYDTFSIFGMLVAPPKIARDDSGQSKCFGFISFDSFEAADAAIEGMNNQFLMNKSITVGYAFKKDGKGERHGDQAERLLASQARKNNVNLQPTPMPALPSGFTGQAPIGYTGQVPQNPAGFPQNPAGFPQQPMGYLYQNYPGNVSQGYVQQPPATGVLPMMNSYPVVPPPPPLSNFGR
ncbi:hypothetical protein T552_01799 [Pneumocystis carinii B80]|uniref:RRM domain-containing protein n=1 Tax=Pneumocystis carinii (strain B80) TaxID=1408658 RepID=A0A0W4ZJH8_PNEC8|nr:hypothetical protein T552_01799 [Pneumocystis carinii B80]KTW28539.1 hypothetical protein T552_01799 [Pneumocystis carinii B80]